MQLLFVWIILMLGNVIASSAFADPVCDKASDSATIDWHQVSAPSGKFLLMKGSAGVCAIRFTKYEKSEKVPPSIFSSGGETHKARYEWYFQGDGSSAFTNENAQHGTDEVSHGPMVGVGRAGYEKGDPYLKCGPFKTFWMQPTSVSFSSKVSCKEATLELSPTNWEEISQVRADDSKLKWYHCDEKRKSFTIPKEEL